MEQQVQRLTEVPSKGSYDSIRHFVYSDSVASWIYRLYRDYRWINCIADMDPEKKTVGTANPWTANHLTVKIGYVLSKVISAS